MEIISSCKWINQWKIQLCCRVKEFLVTFVIVDTLGSLATATDFYERGKYQLKLATFKPAISV